MVTHRLIADNGDGTYTTQGDANNVADLTPVEQSDIIGGVVASQPELGFWWMYATRPVGAASIAVTLLMLYLIWGLFTATPDLHSEFPALAARELGIVDVPLMCATEIGVQGAMPRVVRLMAHVETERDRTRIQHVYLRGATSLRKDIAQ